IGPTRARSLLRFARDAELSPHARAWVEHVATWGSGAQGWTRACGTIERVHGTITTTTGDELRVEVVRWSRTALPPELRLAAGCDQLLGDVPLGSGGAHQAAERSSVVRALLVPAYSGLLGLRLDDGRAWTIRAWPTENGVAAEDHAAHPIVVDRDRR
nr:hypothetical protein [Myxococcota bacterium]